MYQNKTILAIIPARGGSKGVPRKNIRELGGKPLIAWTIDSARSSNYLDRLILSSEDQEIIEVAKKIGCEVPFKRPIELAQDETEGVAPVLHAIEKVEGYDYVVLLQPTSPFRLGKDIDHCIELCVNSGANTATTVTEPEKSPYWMYQVDRHSGRMSQLLPQELILRRQDLSPVYSLNGAVYVAKIEWLKEKRTLLPPGTVAYIMPKSRSMDIDTELDLKICESMVQYFIRDQVQ